MTRYFGKPKTAAVMAVIFSPSDDFFQVSTSGCGRSQSCFRVCGLRPRCDPAESVYMVIIRPDLDREEITFRLGGLLRDNQARAGG